MTARQQWEITERSRKTMLLSGLRKVMIYKKIFHFTLSFPGLTVSTPTACYSLAEQPSLCNGTCFSFVVNLVWFTRDNGGCGLTGHFQPSRLTDPQQCLCSWFLSDVGQSSAVHRWQMVRHTFRRWLYLHQPFTCSGINDFVMTKFVSHQ